MLRRSTKISFVFIIGYFLAVFMSANPTQEAATDLAIIHGPYLQNVGETTATVLWFTNKNCVSRVEYSTGDNFRTFPRWGGLVQTAVASHHGLIDAHSRVHRIVLSGLQPGTEYRYRIVSKEITQFEPYEVLYGITVVSEIFRFQTWDQRDNSVNFCVINDIHENQDRLAAILDTVPWEGLDMVFLNGDTLNHFEDDEQIFEGFLDSCVKFFAREIPFIFVRGNHETRGKKARHLIDYLATKENRFYYSFSHGPVRFLVLDSGEDKPDGHPVYAGLADFDRYRDLQAEWLKKEAESASFQAAAFQVAICHIPPFGGNNWHGEQYLRRVWNPVFNETGIDLLICGHTHQLLRLDADENHNYPILINGLDMYVSVSVSGEKMAIEVLDTDGHIRDSFSISKDGIEKTSGWDF